MNPSPDEAADDDPEEGDEDPDEDEEKDLPRMSASDSSEDVSGCRDPDREDWCDKELPDDESTGLSRYRTSLRNHARLCLDKMGAAFSIASNISSSDRTFSPRSGTIKLWSL
jgi:hypothetical protein